MINTFMLLLRAIMIVIVSAHVSDKAVVIYDSYFVTQAVQVDQLDC